MEDSLSKQTSQSRPKLKRLSRVAAKHSDSDEPKEQSKQPELDLQQSQVKEKKSKRKSKGTKSKKSVSTKKQPKEKKSPKNKAQKYKEEEIYQTKQEEKQTEANKTNAIEETKTQKDDKRNSLYKSSQEQGEEDKMPEFIGLDANKKKRSRKSPKQKKPKKQIRTSNRFFKCQDFDAYAKYQTSELQTGQTPAEIELHISTKQVVKLPTDFLQKRAQVVKKNRGVVENNNQSQNTFSNDQLKKILSKDISKVDIDIQIEVPRKNAGMSNKILDHTIFLKQLKNKQVDANGHNSNPSQIVQQQYAKKRVSRCEYMRQMEEDIKNRRAKTMSTQQLMECFVVSTLDELAPIVKKQSEDTTKQKMLIQNVPNLGITPEAANSIVVQPKALKQQNSKQHRTTSIIQNKEQSKPKDNNKIQENIKKQNKAGNKSKQLNKKQICSVFDDEAVESGQQQGEREDESDQNQDLKDLIDNEVSLIPENEQLALKKFLADEQARDDSMIKKIMNKQFKKKKIEMPAESQQVKKQERREYIKKMLQDRQIRQDKILQNNKPKQQTTAIDKMQYQVEESKAHHSLVQSKGSIIQKKRSSNSEFEAWLFAQPQNKKANAMTRRSSLLNVSGDSNAISGFEPKKATHNQRASDKFMGSSVNKLFWKG